MPLPLYESHQNTKPSEIKFIIGIAAGKGGVGKSTLTVNLSLALQALGFQVGILDTDLYGPSIRKMLPEDHLPTQKGQFLFPAISMGIKIISMAYFKKEEEASVIRAPIANGLITQFLKNAVWGPLDFLLVDFPPGTGDIQLTVSQHANLAGAVMITTPQDISVIDVRKAIKMFDHVHVPIIGIVENMSGYLDSRGVSIPIFGQGGGERLAREIGVPLLGNIPLDPALCRLGDEGKSLFEFDPERINATTQAFLSVAHQLVNHVKWMKEETSNCLKDFELIWKEMPS